MPTIAWFYGIAIRMYFGITRRRIFMRFMANTKAFVAIESGEVIGGALPKAAARLVKEWALARQGQLRENWRLARTGEQPERIAGLDADQSDPS